MLDSLTRGGGGKQYAKVLIKNTSTDVRPYGNICREYSNQYYLPWYTENMLKIVCFRKYSFTFCLDIFMSSLFRSGLVNDICQCYSRLTTTYIAPLGQLPGPVAPCLPRLIYIWSLLIHRFVAMKTKEIFLTKHWCSMSQCSITALRFFFVVVI